MICLCEKCFADYGKHETLTLVPSSPCVECGICDDRYNHGAAVHAFPYDPRQLMEQKGENDMSEKDLLLSIMQRLEKNGGVDGYFSSPLSPHDGESTIEVDSHGWHGYGVRFNFDKDGNIVGISAGA